MQRGLIISFMSVVLATGWVTVAWARMPNDTFYSKQWHLRQINAEAAWDKTVGSDKVVVAVIDTGVDIEHEDLRDNIWTNAGEIPDNGLDDDKNGFVDDVHGWNFLTNSNNVRPRETGSTEEGFIHGTLVASLIGARGDNGIGVAGVAWKVKLMPLVALDETGAGSSDTVAEAVRYAARNGAQIINMSLEGFTDSEELRSALLYARSKGVLTVAATGNSDEPSGFDLDVLPVYPACWSADTSYGVLAVGGTDTLDQKALRSNYGSCVNLTAPAYKMFGAVPVSSSTAKAAGYADDYSGTSLAVPLVSGAAALLKAAHPDWSAQELRARLIASALPIDDLQINAYRGRLGRGRLDLAAALADVTTSTPAVFTVSSTAPGAPTRVRIGGLKSPVEIQPYGASDRRGARAAFMDADGDGKPEIIVVPASGRDLTWILFGLDGKERKRGTLAKDLKNGALLVPVQDGVVIADANGGRAWGMASPPAGTARDMETVLFYPYGKAFRAGLDLLAAGDAAAFAPRGGGGHLVVFNVKGQRLVSAFPFGAGARGRWSLSRLPKTPERPESLVFSGPLGSRRLDTDKLGSNGWQVVSQKEFAEAKTMPAASLPPASRLPAGQAGTGWDWQGRQAPAFDEWPR